MKRQVVPIMLVALAGLALSAHGRDALDHSKAAPVEVALSPNYCNTSHDVGRLTLGVSNDGAIGGAYGFSVSSALDCFTGEDVPGCEYPKGSRTMYLWSGVLWIGGLVGEDTLVSTGADGWAVQGHEYHPDERSITYRSTLDPEGPWSEGAISEEDLVAVFYDTCTACSGVSLDEVDGRPHRPLYLEVTRETYAWSYPYADDFVIFNHTIRNIGTNPISKMYIGMYVDGDVHDLALDGYAGATDDFTGFRGSVPDPTRSGSCPGDVALNLAWIADNDGDMGQPYYGQVRNITGMSVLGELAPGAQVSYNWWASNAGDPALDFGPTRRENIRDFGTGGTGTPPGDRNKYFLLSNGDQDYDQPRIATIGPLDPVWLPPAMTPVEAYCVGSDTKYLISAGPFDLNPGESMPFVMAYVGGMEFHKSASNLENLPYNPDAWYDGVNLDSLTINAIWANWVYDNPGVDTDSDAYRGQFEMCGDDTIWVTGDGIPDLRASSPPPGPQLWVEPIADGLKARWNGFLSEATMDVFLRDADFEGYRAYLSTTGQYGDYVAVANYDIEDYRRYFWSSEFHVWVINPVPFTVEEAVCHHAPGGCDNPDWHPVDYPRTTPYIMPGTDSVFYFEPVMANAYVFGLETPFEKRFPDAPKPPYARPSDVPAEEADLYLTDDGYFRYYEYEYRLIDLVPGQTYWFAVTAFDYGSVTSRGSLESSITYNAVSVVPMGEISCCEGRVGNVDCSASDEPSLGDIERLIDFMFVSQSPLCCVAEADINLSGGAAPTAEDVTLGDIGAMIWYLFLSHGEFPECR